MPGTLPFSNKSTISANNSAFKSSSYNNSEGEQSPTGTIASIPCAHEFSVFANVNIQGSAPSLSLSQMNLTANAGDGGDTMSLNAAAPPPELPKRSNSITSLSNNGKPITLSPRTTDIPAHASRSQPITSPTSLGCVCEEQTPPLPPLSAFSGTLPPRCD